MKNYATKSNLKNATDVDTSKFAKRVDLASSISDTDKLDIYKLETTPVDLGNLIDAVKRELLKTMSMMNWFKKFMLFRITILVI